MRKSCFAFIKTLTFTALLSAVGFLQAEEKPFVIVIPSYNNEAYCEENLRSVFEQDYKNYRVIYIDDCSTDATYAKAKAYTERSGLAQRVALIHNEKNCGAMENIYRAVQSCQDHEVVVMLDGDDFLFTPQALHILNQTYQDPNVWITYGNCVLFPVDSNQTQRGLMKAVSPDLLRRGKIRAQLSKQTWPFTHLKTFYAGLFKQIRLQDLTQNGRFLESTSDQAMMLPMVEMAGEHTRFVGDVLYIYNASTPLNDHKVNAKKQRRCRDYIWSLPPYPLLAELPLRRQGEEKKLAADLVIFSYDRPIQLYACIESILRYVQGMGSISVVYRASQEKYEEGYRLVKTAFPNVIYKRQSGTPHLDFKPLVMEAAFSSPSNYIAFVVDDIVVKDAIDLQACAAAMERAGAYGFYLRLGKHIDFCYTMNLPQNIPPLIELGQEICAWRLSEGPGDWLYPNSVDMTLYKKEEIKGTLNALQFKNPNEMEAKWSTVSQNSKFGLCYAKSKIVNIPMNMVNTTFKNRHMEGYTPEELLKHFMSGQKIDIAPLYQIENRSPHIEYHPTFIER